MYYCTTSTVTHLVNVTVGIKSATSAAKELKKQMPLQTASGSHLSSVVKVSWKLEILFIYTCQKSQENQIQCSETIIDLTWTRAGHRKQSQRREKNLKVSLIDKNSELQARAQHECAVALVRQQIKRDPLWIFCFWPHKHWFTSLKLESDQGSMSGSLVGLGKYAATT